MDTNDFDDASGVCDDENILIANVNDDDDDDGDDDDDVDDE